MNICLYHGWLLDPQEEDVATAIHSLSYNQLVETIIDNKHSDDQELVSDNLLAAWTILVTREDPPPIWIYSIP